MINLDSLKQQATKIKNILTKTPLEQTLSEATSNENWNTPTKLLQEIADATYGYSSCDTIMKFIWKRLDSDNREWRRILKTLNMIEYLIKNGAPRCVGEFRDNMFKVRSFSDFYLIESGSDKGLSIREKTKQLVDLLSNEKLIEEERENAKKIRERLAEAACGNQSIGSNTPYQGMGYDSNKNTMNNDNNDWQRNNPNRNTDVDYTQRYGLYTGGLDKYKNNQEVPKSAEKLTNQTTQSTQPKAEQQTVPQPFSEPAKRLAKPGEKWDVPAPKTQAQGQVQTQQGPSQGQQASKEAVSLIDFDTPTQAQPQPPTPQLPQQSQPLIQPPSSSNTGFDAQWGQFVQGTPQSVQQPTQQQQTFVQAPTQKPQQTNLLPPDIFSAQSQQPQSNQWQGAVGSQSNQLNQAPAQVGSLQQQFLLNQNQQQYQMNQMNYNQMQMMNQYQQPSSQQQFQQAQYGGIYGQMGAGGQGAQQFMQQPTPYPQQQGGAMQSNIPQMSMQMNQQQQPVYRSQAPPQKGDDDFLEFQGSTSSINKAPAQKSSKNDVDLNLLGMLDLVKEKEEMQKQQQQQQQQNYSYTNQQQLYLNQAELDSFQMSRTPNYNMGYGGYR